MVNAGKNQLWAENSNGKFSVLLVCERGAASLVQQFQFCRQVAALKDNIKVVVHLFDRCPQ